MDDTHFMRLAIQAARAGVAQGQTPFGACIVRGTTVVACGHNQVWATTDITAHGEVVTLRAACRALGTIDLSGTTIYSTCEPCPMCFAAIHWARCARLVYGAAIADAQRAGFNELTVSNTELKRLGGSPVEIVNGVLRDDCARLFDEWLASPGRRVY
jgi:tRNA(Arg) A34 adenosine deaminase TadA